jgi:hypothetical protein
VTVLCQIPGCGAKVADPYVHSSAGRFCCDHISRVEISSRYSRPMRRGRCYRERLPGIWWNELDARVGTDRVSA